MTGIYRVVGQSHRERGGGDRIRWDQITSEWGEQIHREQEDWTHREWGDRIHKEQKDWIHREQRDRIHNKKKCTRSGLAHVALR